MFKFHYSQPEDYHFTVDSVIAPELIARQMQSQKFDFSKAKILDLCAGCGVMGFELWSHFPEINHLDFVEVQDEYRPHFQTNLIDICNQMSINPSLVNFKFYNLNYRDLKHFDWKSKYDLVIANPPYFYPDQGRVPENSMRRRSRFFFDSNLETLIEAMGNVLVSGGNAFFLLRNSRDHGKNDQVDLVKGLWSCFGTLENQFDIRGTVLIQLVRNNF